MKSVKIKGADASISFLTDKEEDCKMFSDGKKLNFSAEGGFFMNSIDMLTSFLTVKDSYIDPQINGSTANATMASYIRFTNLGKLKLGKTETPVDKDLVIIFGTTPETNGDGFLKGATSGNAWIPTSSDGVELKVFKSPGQFRVTALPYSGTYYNYGWRVINYLKDGYGGFNIRYGNSTSGIRFSFTMIGFIDKGDTDEIVR